MPRKAPDKVIEHRISFSDLERRKIIESIDEINRLRPVKAWGGAIGSAGGGGALVFAAILGAFYLGWDGKSFLDNLKGLAKTAADPFGLLEGKIGDRIAKNEARIIELESVLSDANSTSAAKAAAQKEKIKLMNDNQKLTDMVESDRWALGDWMHDLFMWTKNPTAGWGWTKPDD